jgi:hypothetical protein
MKYSGKKQVIATLIATTVIVGSMQGVVSAPCVIIVVVPLNSI